MKPGPFRNRYCRPIENQTRARRSGRRAVLKAVAATATAATLLLCPAPAQDTAPFSAELTIRADRPGETINRNIYGHFAEHLGRCIYEGIWVGEGSPIPNTRGIRNDVVAALRNLDIPVLRWPGGCFADEYHWRDGIGPRDQRPKRINTHWGGVIETNHFGTHEFMDLCEMIGADAYVCGNVGSGTPEEMMEWVEYMTSDSQSTLAELRRRNGRDKPWKLPYFGVGNESWGCGGSMRPEYYADQFRRYATFVKNYPGNRVQKIACGANSEDYRWTEVLMSQAARQMQGLSLHYYTVPTGNWGRKGSATQFGEDQWHSTLLRTLRIDEMILKHASIMDKYDPQKRVSLIVDEWGAWYDPEPGSNPGFLYQQNSLRDAIVAAVNLNIFNRHADRVKMANIAQTINVLQAMILTEKEKMILTPTYHVFEMYKVHQGATSVPVELTAPEYRLGDAAVPALHASASRDVSGAIHLSIANLEPNRPAKVAARITGSKAGKIAGRVLTAQAMNAINTFDGPDAVKPAPFQDARIEGDSITLALPAKSVVVLAIH
ncbi:MAG: alpha-N-arabinofuranosidase [Acidobacteria bacterium]|nr:alpha-N-arabinofuranosidase [Acidobacteriota bacterium]